MSSLGFTILLILAGVGLFFAFPMAVAVVPFLVIPAFALYALYRFFDEDKGTYSKAYSKATVSPGSMADTLSLASFVQDKASRTPHEVFKDGTWSEDTTISGDLKERIENFLEQFPSDASCTVKVSQFGSRWLVRFMINSVQARFTALGLSKDIEKAVESVERQLLDQLEHWRRERFANSRWMKRVEDQVLTQISEEVERPVRVLIVDDDVDAALLVDSVFRERGCETRLALTVQEARQMISQMTSDIIVLDWKLSRDVNADQVLLESISKLEERDEVSSDRAHPKVVTYSSLPGEEITFPESRFFDHIDHWKKPIQYGEMANKTRGVLAAASF